MVRLGRNKWEEKRECHEKRGVTRKPREAIKKKRGRRKKELIPPSWSKKITNFFTKPRGVEKEADILEWESCPTLSEEDIMRLESIKQREERLRKANWLAKSWDEERKSRTCLKLVAKDMLLRWTEQNQAKKKTFSAK